MLPFLVVPMVAAAASGAAAAQPPNVLFVVGDDVGYSDFGYFNDRKTITPTIDGLLEEGIFLSVSVLCSVCDACLAALVDNTANITCRRAPLLCGLRKGWWWGPRAGYSWQAWPWPRGRLCLGRTSGGGTWQECAESRVPRAA
jgi:hypothetical protein